MIAVVPVRAGALPAGALETLAEAGGRALVVGEGTEQAAGSLLEDAGAVRLTRLEAGAFAPGRFARALGPLVSVEDVVLLPASPDGRDLAPRLAAELDRPLLAGAIRVGPGGATVVAMHGAQNVELSVDGPFVATLLPGARSPAPRRPGAPTPGVELSEPSPAPGEGPADAEVLGTLDPDPSAVDLSEAGRILAAGAGLPGEELARLFALGERLGAAVGATRVVTDAGLVAHDRQIGTTGVSVRPRLYVAFGVSGAAQHVGGLGEPDHVISVNLDPSCPMMAMADLAVVADAGATLRALAARLEERAGG